MPLIAHHMFEQRRSVYFLYFVACLYLILLVSFSCPDVFYSGDGGLKFMMIKQICSGEDFRYIAHTQPKWVEDIWAQGFFPIRRVFVFPAPQGQFFVFPPPFEMVNAVVYQKLGYRGLYLIPAVSLMIFWAWFIWLAEKMAIPGQRTFLLFFLLAFCSPLTLYGAIYWEHTLGILLLFSGIVMIAHPPRRSWQAFVLGFMSGMAVWFRPEALLFCPLYAGAWLIIRRRTAAYWLFMTGALLGITGFLLFNKMKYGLFFGIHGRQILEDQTFLKKCRRIGHNLFYMNLLFCRYFPMILLMIPIVFAWVRRKWPLPRPTVALLLIFGGFWFVSPFFFPDEGGKQWGPRFFLPLMPMSLLIMSDAFRQWREIIMVKYRTALLSFIFLAACYGFIYNTIIGAADLRKDELYRIRPILNDIRKDQGDVVVVNSHFTTMELSAAFREKFFFLANDTEKLDRLIPFLKNNGVDHFIYINFDTIPRGLGYFMSLHHTSLTKKSDYLIGAVPLR